DADQACVARVALVKSRAESSGASELARGLFVALGNRCNPAPPDARAAVERAHAQPLQPLASARARGHVRGALTPEAVAIRPPGTCRATRAPGTPTHRQAATRRGASGLRHC